MKLAVVGATGLVGQEVLKVLGERQLDIDELIPVASKRSAGRLLNFNGEENKVVDIDKALELKPDAAIFSAGGDISLKYAPLFAAVGCTVVDNSSAWRMHPEVPLVVPEVNGHELRSLPKGIVANPNCTTMTLMMAAGPLHRVAGLRSVVASSYQAVSGSGRQGVEELVHQVDALRPGLEALIRGGWADPGPKLYPRPIGFNVLPFAGSEVEGGYTDEEMKLVNESRKILEIDDLLVEPTCVRVPVMVGHGVSATLRFERPVGVEEAVEVLNDAPGIEVWSDHVPTPLDSTGLDVMLVGRIRATLGEPGGINLWVVGDNLRKGAALNAVQIAELLV